MKGNGDYDYDHDDDDHDDDDDKKLGVFEVIPVEKDDDWWAGLDNDDNDGGR